MADIPKLDPKQNNISWFAYYDVSEQVSSSMYDETGLNNTENAGGFSDSIAENGGSYNNGVIFNYVNKNVNRNITIRAGSNRKITAHIEYKGKSGTYDSDFSSEYNGYNFTQSGTSISDISSNSDKSGLKGDYDLLEWKGPGSPQSFNDNILFSAIHNCINSTNWSSEINVDRDNMRLHNYRFSDNLNVSTFSSSNAGGSYAYTSSTTIKKAYLTYYGNELTNYDGYYTLRIDGTRIVYSQEGEDYLALDITDIVRNNPEFNIEAKSDGRAKLRLNNIVVWK